MNIISYQYNDIQEERWNFQETFFGRINLIVGDSGAGKTRFINTITNLAAQVTSEKLKHSGHWNIKFQIKGKIYRWELHVERNNIRDEVVIIKDNVFRIMESDVEEPIIVRDKNQFIYNGERLPKLSRATSSIALLKEDDEITEIYNGFKTMLTRRFYTDELSKNFAFLQVSKKKIAELQNEGSLENILSTDIGFYHKLDLLKKIFPKKYEELIDLYQEIFPFISKMKIFKVSEIKSEFDLTFNSPVLCFKEKNIDNWIPVNDISSGMQKIFLLALDVFLMPDGGILLIDEYENSLGVNAINYFPDIFYDSHHNCQYIISSHHPYIINKLDVKNWLLFNRQGMNVKIKSGKDIEDKYNSSSQEKFIQLLNDPFYSEGIE